SSGRAWDAGSRSGDSTVFVTDPQVAAVGHTLQSAASGNAGATFTGADVAEFVHAATIAIVGELTLDRLWHAVPSFPTRSEVWLRLLEGYGL
ncbi:MAG TPA: hypothetical protein VJ986_03465, partial [Gaiellaceae bacterium]|nr:hypothetical protein [Gaiellaceae bacterium]